MERRRFLSTTAIASAALLVSNRAFGFPDPKTLRNLISEDGGDKILWDEIRKYFLYPGSLCYLNTAGNGALPENILTKVCDAMRDDAINPGPGVKGERWDNVKKKCAGLLSEDFDVSEIALISSATEGINIIINGLPLKKNDEVIISSHEHPSLVVPLLNRMKKDGIVIKIFDPDLKDTYANIDKIKELINKRTKLIFISHVTYTTGQISPIKEIGLLAKENNIWFAVDGAQAPGNILADLNDSNVDFYAFSGHKWLLGPKRTGVLYVKKKMIETCKPVNVGGGSYENYDLSKQQLQLYDSAMRYEYGTRNNALFYGLEEAIGFIDEIGIKKIYDHNKMLAEQFVEGLRNMNSITLRSPEEKKYRTPIVSFSIEGKDCMDVYYYLITKKKIRVRPVFENGFNFIRASFHLYNNEEDVDRLLFELKDI